MHVKRSFRLTKEQAVYMEKQCKSMGITSSAYIRKLLDEQRCNRPIIPLWTMEEREYHAKLLGEINRIGVNINQIVKNVNSFFYSRKEKEELYKLLKEIYGLLEREEMMRTSQSSSLLEQSTQEKEVVMPG